MKILFIIVAALIFRLISINQSLWLDEAIVVLNSQKFSFLDFLTVYSLGDFHPPLYFAIVWVWTRIFGISEIAVRIPSVVLGVITVWFTYLIGKSLFGKKTGLTAAVILAFNPLHVYYSQEARMYSLAAFSAVFNYWAFVNFIKGKRFALLTYSFSVVLILYSEYLLYFSLVSQMIYVVLIERKKLVKFITGLFFGGIFWIPWLLVFPSQLKTGQNAAVQIPGWAYIVGGANVKQLVLVWVKSIIGRVGFENKLVYLLIVLPVSGIYGFVLFKAIKTLSKEIKLLLLWIIIPILFAFFISFYIPVLSYFRMIFVLPGLVLLLAYGVEKINRKYQKFFLAALLIISSGFLLMYYLDPKFQREDWKSAISFIKAKNGFVLFEDSNIPAPAKYYGCNVKCSPALKNFPANTELDLKIQEVISNTSKVYLFDYLVEISDPKRLVEKELKETFELSRTYNFNGVGFVYEYKKQLQ